MAADQSRGYGQKQAEWSRPGTFRETCLARAERGQTGASPEQPGGAGPQEPLTNQPTGTVSKPAGNGLKCGLLPAATRKEINMETLIALMLCVDPMWHQSRHLSSATRRCVTRCVAFVMALLVAPPTQMESKTCTCCKHESTDWKSLPLLFSLMYNLSMQPCHPARYSPSPMCLLQGLSRPAMLHQQGDV